MSRRIDAIVVWEFHREAIGIMCVETNSRLRRFDLAAWGLVLFALASPAAAAPPNIVLIMADDLGAGELGCYGHPEHQTPQLDQLAKQGLRYQTCYATPKCTSTRMLIMTGRYGFRTGWFDFLEDKYSPLPGSPQFDIGAAELTFADILKQKNYATGIAGKWQLPGSPQNRIFDCGFDTYCMWLWKHELPDIDPVTGIDRVKFDPNQSLQAKKGRAKRYWHPGIMVDAKLRPTTADDYGPDIFTDFVCDFIREHKSEPFVVYYSMALVHKPLRAVPDLKNPGQRIGEGELRASVEYMDHLVGRITRTVDELGLGDNTFIFFTGDNGTQGHGKGDVTELGSRVPMIVRGPGIQPGRTTDDLTDLSDVLPTFAELAGAPLPEDREIDGVSMVPTLLDRPGPRRDWIFSYLADERLLRDQRWLLEGDGQFYDCGESRDGTNYKNVTNSTDPEVLTARRRFERIMETLPGPVTNDES